MLYHDAIYHAGRKDNEARSAQLALQAIAQAPELAAVDAARVGQLILLTARHGELGPQDVDAEAALFLDCDMAILAAPEPVFAAYDRGVADEYKGVVPGFLYRASAVGSCRACCGRRGFSSVTSSTNGWMRPLRRT